MEGEGETLNGCGKSSLLSKIQGIHHNGIIAAGDIYYPTKNGQPTKIVSVSQQDYFPLYSTLIKVINYPNQLPIGNTLTELRNKILILIEQIDLNKRATTINNILDDVNNLLDEEREDWSTELSGGQKKKIILISSIIKQPDILILDEVFNGLDHDSIIKIQKIIKGYLPDALIIVVDHHAHDNNFNGFYDQEIHFSNHTIEVRPIAPIETNEQLQEALHATILAVNEIHEQIMLRYIFFDSKPIK